jgi:antirestriction protein ArdC
MAIDVFKKVTDNIMAQLEQGTVPWHKPWKSVGGPRNLESGRQYRGINVFLLELQGFASPYWLTFNGVRRLGGHVKKGSKATVVVLWRFIEKNKKTKDGKIKKGKDGKPEKDVIPFLRYYNVFNVEQCGGLEEHIARREKEHKQTEVKPIQACEDVVDGFETKPPINYGGNVAAYSPSKDKIRMPQKKQFDGMEEHYSTLFHELVHSTGHHSRLDRKEVANVQPFGSEDYSKEELVAEMGAAMLCGFTGIANRTINNSAAYVQHWLGKLAGDKKLVVCAAATAQRAVDLILGTKFEDEDE